ncbi:MAG: hypothetical protein V3U66_04335 [Acidobacteriota bacterium]
MRKDEVYIISDEDLGSPFGITGSDKGKKDDGKVRSDLSAVDRYEGSGDGRPRTAASLSLWICGTGQLLHGEWKIGSLYLLVLGFVFSFHYFLHQAWSRMTSWAEAVRLSEFDLLIGVILMDLYLAVVLLSGIYNAYRIGKALVDVEEEPSPHPLVAGLASLVIPGWGQIINGQIKKAVLFLFVVFCEIFALGLWWSVRNPVERLFLQDGNSTRVLIFLFALGAFWLVAWTLSVYDAILVSRYRRGGIP